MTVNNRCCYCVHLMNSLEASYEFVTLTNTIYSSIGKVQTTNINSGNGNQSRKYQNHFADYITFIELFINRTNLQINTRPFTKKGI